MIELVFSDDDMKNILSKVCTTDWQKEVTQFLLSNYTYYGGNSLNLRTQYKAFKTYEYALKNNLDWKIELKAELDAERSEINKIVYRLIGKMVVTSSDFKRLLLRSGAVNSLSTARLRLNEWLELGEVYKVSGDKKDFEVCILPLDKLKEINRMRCQE